MRIFALTLALIAQTVPVYAQNTKAALQSQINSTFVDNTSGAITPATTRTFLNNLVNSVQQAPAVNPQVGTTYPIVAADYGQVITFTNNSPIAVTIPTATGSFAVFNVFMKNLGTGTVTVTPVSGTIGGNANLAISTNQGAWLVSDGSNWQVGFAGGGSGGGTPGGANTQVQFNSSGVFAGSNTLTWISPTLTIGLAGAGTGQLALAGTGSGTITIAPQAAAGTYNFNLPTVAGTAGQPLLSGGGGAAAMTFGSLAINQLAAIAANNIIANATGGSAVPTAVPLVDCASAGNALNYSFSTHAFSCNIISGSGTVQPGTAGQLTWYPASTNVVQGNPNATMSSGQLSLGQAAGPAGQLLLYGSSTGGAIIATQAAAGGPVITLGISSGTAAVVGVAPLTIASTTGAISITGVAGEILAGAAATFTATPTIGISSATGAISFDGLTSGRVKLSVLDVAGSWTMKLPASAGVNGQFLSTDGSGNTSWGSPSGSGTVVSGLTGQLAYYPGSAASVSGNTNANISAGALTLGQLNTTQGSLILNGGTSGAISILPQAAAGTFNFNLPITAGAAGNLLLSGGGGATAMSWSTGMTYTSGGPLSISPTVGGATQALTIAQTGVNTGSQAASNVFYNQIVVSDGNNPGAGIFTVPFLVEHDIQSNSTGEKVGLYIRSFRNTSATSSMGDQIAIATAALASVSDGGTNTGAGAHGTIFGANPSVTMNSGATNYYEVTGAEIDVGINTGATARHRLGLGVVSVGSAGVNGAQLDAAIAIEGATTSQWGYGILFSNTIQLGTGAPVLSSGTLIGTDSAGTVTSGIDWSLYTFTGYFLRSATFSATGTGLVNAVQGYVINGSTDLSPRGRLTSVTGVPVPTGTTNTSTTLYYDCYNGGNKVPYYNGANDLVDTIAACQVSTAMVSAASAGQVVAGQIYDVWWEGNTHHNICIAMSASGGGGVGWPSVTARSGIAALDTSTRAYTTNANTIANCFNGSTNYGGSLTANKLTYLGTIYAAANGTVNMDLKPVSAAGGTNNVLSVYNGYNRVRVCGFNQDSNGFWTTTNTSFEALDVGGAASGTHNRVIWVDGLQQSTPVGDMSAAMYNSGASNTQFGLVLDSTSATPNAIAATNGTLNVTSAISESFLPQSGLHFIQAVQKVAAASTGTISGGGFESISVCLEM